MKTLSLKNVVIFRLVLALALSSSHVANTMTETKALPNVDIQAMKTHQKELKAANTRGRHPANIFKGPSKKTRKMVAKLVFEEVSLSLPEKQKIKANKIARVIIEEANKHGFDPLFLIAIMKHESYFNPDMIGSFKEEGLMQIKPSTAEWINKKLKLGHKKINLFDPTTNIKIGTAYMSYLREKFDKKSPLYVAAYNMGPMNVKKLLKQNQQPREYSEKVMKHYQDLIETLEVKMMSEPFPSKVALN